MCVVKGYRDQKQLRESFMELARKTFDLDFSDWYENGYWGENYIPYSISDHGKIVANVSVNRMRFLIDGIEKNYIQLGTVMTEKDYRNKGLIRYLMGEVEKDYGKEMDGIYLFANDTVLDFYPKFGFREEKEIQYGKKVSVVGEKSAFLYPVKGEKERKVLERAVETSVCQGRFSMNRNVSLVMFYLSKFMQENVYYLPRQNAYVVAEYQGDVLFLYDVFADKRVDLDSVIEAFGKEVRRVELGFTPFPGSGYEKKIWKEEDTTLFVKGKELLGFSARDMMFPLLSHA